MLLYQLLFFLFVHVSLLIPGYVLISNLRPFLRHSGITLSFSYLLSIAFFALLATAGYTLKVPEILLQTISWLVLIGATVVFFYQRLYQQLKEYWLPLTALLLMTLFSVVFIGLSFGGNYKFIPDPEYRSDRDYGSFNVKVLNVSQTNANDNYIPYRQAQFFVNRSDPAKDSFIEEWGVHFFQRTPLMGAVSAQYFIALNDSLPIGYTWSNDSSDPDHTYIKFQIIAHILNALFILPAFYIIRRFFDKRSAVMALCFIIPSQYFLYNAFFSWPKSLVAFFILLSWLLILERRFMYLVLAGVASGLAYLTHDLAVLYIGASIFMLLYQKRFRDTVVFGAVSALFALPWLLISAVLYKKPSSFILYPLSIHNIPQPEQRHLIIEEFLNTSPIRLLLIRLESLYYLLSPYQLIYSEGSQTVMRRLWAAGIFSIPGSIGLGLIVPTILGAVSKIKDVGYWLLALVPIILSVLVIGWPKGLGSVHFAQASVVLLTGLACYWLANTGRSAWSYIAYLLSTAQLIFFIAYSYPNNISIWAQNSGDILRLGVMAVIVSICVLGIYIVRRPGSKLHQLLIAS